MLAISGSTRRFWTVMVPLAAAFVAVQFRLGEWGLRVFPQTTEPLMRALFGYLPFAASALVLSGLMLMHRRYAGWSFEFAPGGLVVRRGRKRETLDWSGIFVARTRRQAVIGDGHCSVTIDRFFFPEFDRLCELVDKARRHQRDAQVMTP